MVKMGQLFQYSVEGKRQHDFFLTFHFLFIHLFFDQREFHIVINVFPWANYCKLGSLDNCLLLLWKYRAVYEGAGKCLLEIGKSKPEMRMDSFCLRNFSPVQILHHTRNNQQVKKRLKKKCIYIYLLN